MSLCTYFFPSDLAVLSASGRGIALKPNLLNMAWEILVKAGERFGTSMVLSFLSLRLKTWGKGIGIALIELFIAIPVFSLRSQ
jgi:hypothetical protein